jgi:selenocysteine-specific elongation factor
VGTAAAQARLAMLEVTEMTGGQTQMVQLRLAEPLPLVPGDRFVIRANVNTDGQSGLTTIGGGRILGISNTRLRRKKPWTLDALVQRREALDHTARWCETMLREQSGLMTAAELEQRCLIASKDLAEIISGLQREGRILAAPNGALVHQAIVDQTAQTLLAAIQELHQSAPQRAGLSREELAPKAGGSPELCGLALDQLLRARQIERNGTVFARAGWSTRLSDRDQRLCDQLAQAFKQANWTTPAPADLAPTLRETPDRLERMIRLLCERGVLVKLEERVFMHRDAIAAARQVALRLFKARPGFTTMDFRDALGVSRKYAVPLLDYLDKTRFTVRNGHDRTPGVEARKLMT